MIKPRIYLAGPDVFYPCDLISGEEKINICEELGGIGLYPSFLLPKNLFSDDYTAIEKSKIINQACKGGILDADLLVANLSPFRGFEMDSGTAFEIGYADALSVPIYGYTNDHRTYLERMISDSSGVYQETNGTWRDKNHHVIENFDLSDNCMISKSCVKFFKPENKNEADINLKNPQFYFKEAVKAAIEQFHLDLESNKSIINQINLKMKNQHRKNLSF